MRNDDQAAGVTYIGPRTFVIAFCAVCALFLTLFFGLNQVWDSLESQTPDSAAVVASAQTSASPIEPPPADRNAIAGIALTTKSIAAPLSEPSIVPSVEPNRQLQTVAQQRPPTASSAPGPAGMALTARTLASAQPRPLSVPAATDARATQRFITHRPASQRPATEVRQGQLPVTKAPVTNRLVTNRLVPQAVITRDPAPQLPATPPPITQRPATQRPVTQLPATRFPLTHRPAIEPPATQSVAARGPATQSVAARGPAIQSPATQGQVMQRSVTQPLLSPGFTSRLPPGQPSVAQRRRLNGPARPLTETSPKSRFAIAVAAKLHKLKPAPGSSLSPRSVSTSAIADRDAILVGPSGASARPAAQLLVPFKSAAGARAHTMLDPRTAERGSLVVAPSAQAPRPTVSSIP